MKRLLAPLILLTVAAGCTAHRPPVTAETRPFVAAFDSFWSDFDRTYSYFEHKNIDWPAVRLRFREQAALVESDSAFVALLREAVQPLRDVHVWFTRPDGTQLPSFVPGRSRNFNRAVLAEYAQRFGFTQRPTWSSGRIDNVGYLSIGSWNSTQLTTEELDAALEELRETRALIIDVRTNSGGDDALALRLAGRFTEARVEHGSVQFRNGPEHRDFGNRIPRRLAPRGPWTYSKPVYLLAGRGSFSSNETFVAAMQALPNVTVVGDTTGGSSGNPLQRPILIGGRNTGWHYMVPRWIERTADGTIIEWNGIAPDVVVPFDSESVTNGQDPVLEWTFRQLGIARQGRSGTE
jgi:hypothetical protein